MEQKSQYSLFVETARRNRFDRMEWAGAFADLRTFIPFIAAYLSVLKMDPLGILLAFGISMVACGWFYRTPFPVQPMKAIGAVATTQAAHMTVLTGASVVAGLIAGVIWLVMGLTGMASGIARLVPREVVLGIMLGLGMSFMLEGARMMSANWPIACAAFVVAILLRNSRTFPAMFVLLLGGFGYSIATEATLLEQLGRISIELSLPQLALPALSLNDLLLGAIYLALPQVPLTVLGEILFLAGVLLAATAGMAIWNVAAAFIAGMVLRADFVWMYGPRRPALGCTQSRQPFG